MLSILIIAILVSLVGAVLAVVGLRGRIIGNSPHCRKCGYELTGLDAAKNCPECGSTLGKAGSVTRGLRKRRRSLIALGSLLLVVGVASLVGQQIAQARNFNLYPYKPQWLLLLELNDETARDAVVDELSIRFINDALSPRTIRGYADNTLARLEALPEEETISRKEYDLLQRLIRRQLLDESTLRRAIEAFVVIRAVARPEIRQGDSLEAAVVVKGRVPRPPPPIVMMSANFEFDLFVTGAHVSGKDLLCGRFGTQFGFDGGSFAGFTLPVSRPIPDGIEVGKHEVAIDVSVRLRRANYRSRDGLGSARNPYFEDTLTRKVKFEVVARDVVPHFAGSRSSETDEWFESATRVGALRYYEDPDEPGIYQLLLFMQVAEKRPLAVSQQMLVFFDGKCIEDRPFAITKEGTGSGHSSMFRTHAPPVATTADVYLIPADEMWRIGAATGSGWGGALVFHDVPIRALPVSEDGSYNLAPDDDLASGKLIPPEEAVDVLEQCRAIELEQAPF